MTRQEFYQKWNQWDNDSEGQIWQNRINENGDFTGTVKDDADFEAFGESDFYRFEGETLDAMKLYNEDSRDWELWVLNNNSDAAEIY